MKQQFHCIVSKIFLACRLTSHEMATSRGSHAKKWLRLQFSSSAFAQTSEGTCSASSKVSQLYLRGAMSDLILDQSYRTSLIAIVRTKIRVKNAWLDVQDNVLCVFVKKLYFVGSGSGKYPTCHLPVRFMAPVMPSQFPVNVRASRDICWSWQMLQLAARPISRGI